MSNMLPAGRKAVELAIKHGPKAKVAWDVAGKNAAEQVRIQRVRSVNKKRAFEKARTLAEGSVLRQLHGEQVVWVVFAGDEPVTSYPIIETDLAGLVAHADLTQRDTPEEYDRKRARARARAAARKAGSAARRRVTGAE